MKNALNNQVGMLGYMFLWLVANLKLGVIYFIKQACGNDKRAGVYLSSDRDLPYLATLAVPIWVLLSSFCLLFIIAPVALKAR